VFNNHTNSDDLLYRNIIIGLLAFLEGKVLIKYQISNTEYKLKPVPFFFTNTGDEKFVQDFYIYGDTTKAEGNYDSVPRGIVNFNGLSILTGNFTNKFVRGTYNKEVPGQNSGTVKAFSATINSIPIVLTYSVEIIVDSLTESMKIIEKVIETFYKVNIYNMDFKGLMVPCQLVFSDTQNIEKNLSISYGDDNKIFVKFDLDLFTHHPIMDLQTERFRGNIMSGGIGNVVTDVPGIGKIAGIKIVPGELPDGI
jgi:hypothetical protein